MKFLRMALLVLTLLTPLTLKSETVENNLLLLATYPAADTVHLEWVDLDLPPNTTIFKVYRSEDPSILGDKIATVPNAYTYDDVLLPGDVKLYFYQIIRVN